MIAEVGRRTFLAGILATSAVGLASCGTGGPAGAGGALRVGAWIPLTGAVAATGIPQRAGAAAYFAALNSRGGINGRQVDWVVRDNAYDPQQTIQVARELIGRDRVAAIVNPNGTPTTEAAFPFVLNGTTVPVLNPYGGDDSWFTPPRPRLFSCNVLPEDQAAAAGAWAAEDGARRLLVIHDDPATFVGIANEVAPAAQRVQPAVTAEHLPVKFQSTDYSQAVRHVKNRNPDAVVLIMTAPEAAAYFKEARLQGVSIPAYSYAPVATDEMPLLADGAAEGFKAVQLTRAPSDPHPAVQEFRDAMRRYQPDVKADFVALAGWMNANVFGQIAATIEGEITSESIVAAFERATTVDIGVAPVMSFSPQQHIGTRKVQRATVRDGKWVSVGEFSTPPPRG